MGKGNHNPTTKITRKNNPGMGRPKGAKNKLQTEAKTHIINVFQYLQRTPATSLRNTAKADPSWFYDSIWKLIVPKQISADVNHDISGNLMDLAVQVAQELRLNGDNGNK